jgi:hypothetical protein
MTKKPPDPVTLSRLAAQQSTAPGWRRATPLRARDLLDAERDAQVGPAVLLERRFHGRHLGHDVVAEMPSMKAYVVSNDREIAAVNVHTHTRARQGPC